MMAIAVKGVDGAGFHKTVSPQAKANALFQPENESNYNS
jgi:hypothetical protein